MKTFNQFIKEDDAETFLKWRDHTRKPIPDRTFSGKDGKTYDLKVEKQNSGSMRYNVYHKKNHVGDFYVRSNGLKHISVMNANVDEGHQRNGMATHVYGAIESDSKHTGMQLKPQGYGTPETSPDATKFWMNRDPAKYK